MRKTLLQIFPIACLTLAFSAAPAGAASPAAPEKFTEALFMLHHPAGLNRFAAAVADPGSPRYRHYLSVERLIERFGASPGDRRSTINWLAARGISGRVGPTRAYVTARVPRSFAAAALAPRSEASASAAGIAPRTIPRGLRDHVSSVELLGTTPGEFRHAAAAAPAALGTHPLSSLAPHSGSAAGCPEGRQSGQPAPNTGFTPNQYLDAYGHSAMHRAGYRGRGTKVAVVEIDGFKHSDIRAFGKCFGIRIPPITTVPVGIKKPLEAADETTLDLEVLSAAAPGLERIYVYEGLSSEGGILLTTGAALGSKGHRPDAISMSLEGCGPALNLSLAAHRGIENVFAVAAGAGISVLVAAGDSGSSPCTFEYEEQESAMPLLATSIPGSSPFVTAVGGTNFRLDGANEIRSQVVWNDAPAYFGGGGGGVSVFTPQRPWYQRGKALARYPVGRLVPDIAALADVTPGYSIYCTAPACRPFPQSHPGWISVGGTSAATPLSAGAVLLADEYARRHGQRPLGFLNPLLYDLGKTRKGRHAYFDVRRGNNDLGAMISPAAGGSGPLGCCEARAGYDMASGWGSLRVDAFVRAAAARGR